MSTEDYPKTRVAVALILDESKEKFLWTWNSRWQSFSLPKSKVYRWDAPRGANVDAVTRRAGERAAAEVLGVPVVLHHALNLEPILERSGRDGEMKSYEYVAFRAGAHEKFAGQVRSDQPQIWLAGHEAFSGEFRPLAASSLQVMAQLAEAGLVPGRHQLASTILLTRGPEDAPEFLMRPNPDWGYSFPSKRRADGESAPDAASRVATEELGLKLGATVTLRPGPGGPVAYHAQSESAGVDTFYVHSAFWATLHDGAKLASKDGLAWVPLLDIVNGSTTAPRTTSDDEGKPGKVSRTARRILEALGYF